MTSPHHRCRFIISWWRHQMETFSALLAIWAGNSLHKGQWRGALMFCLFCVWVNGWVNNREAGDLRRYRTHYDVTVMICGRMRYMFSIRENKVLRLGGSPSLTTPPPPMGFCSFMRPVISQGTIIIAIATNITWPVNEWKNDLSLLHQFASHHWPPETCVKMLSNNLCRGIEHNFRERYRQWLCGARHGVIYTNPMRR